jgi:hypothetical protein
MDGGRWPLPTDHGSPACSNSGQWNAIALSPWEIERSRVEHSLLLEQGQVRLQPGKTVYTGVALRPDASMCQGATPRKRGLRVRL